jgi:hypothetical protein
MVEANRQDARAQELNFSAASTALGVQESVLKRYCGHFGITSAEELANRLRAQGFGSIPMFKINGDLSLPQKLNPIEAKSVSNKVEGAMMLLSALPPDMDSGEISKLISRNLSRPMEVEILQGGQYMKRQFSLLDMIGLSYMGSKRIGDKAGSDALLEDYLGALVGIFTEAGTKNEAKNAIKDNISLINNLSLALAFHSREIMDGVEYSPGTISKTRTDIEKSMGEMKAAMVNYAESNPRLKKTIEKMDAEGKEFKRFAYTQLSYEMFKAQGIGTKFGLSDFLDEWAFRFVFDNATPAHPTRAQLDYLVQVRNGYYALSGHISELKDEGDRTSARKAAIALVDALKGASPSQVSVMGPLQITKWQKDSVLNAYKSQYGITNDMVALFFSGKELENAREKNLTESQLAGYLESSCKALGLDYLKFAKAVQTGDLSSVSLQDGMLRRELQGKGYLASENPKENLRTNRMVAQLAINLVGSYADFAAVRGEAAATAALEKALKLIPERAELLKQMQDRSKAIKEKTDIPPVSIVDNIYGRIFMSLNADFNPEEAVTTTENVSATRLTGKSIEDLLQSDPAERAAIFAAIGINVRALEYQEGQKGILVKDPANALDTGNPLITHIWDVMNIQNPQGNGVLDKDKALRAALEFAQAIFSLRTTNGFPVANGGFGGAFREELDMTNTDKLNTLFTQFFTGKRSLEECTGAEFHKFFFEVHENARRGLLPKPISVQEDAQEQTDTQTAEGFRLERAASAWKIPSAKFLDSDLQLGEGLMDAIIKDYQNRTGKWTEDTPMDIALSRFGASDKPGSPSKVFADLVMGYNEALLKNYKALLDDKFGFVFSTIKAASDGLVDKHYPKLNEEQKAEMSKKFECAILSTILGEYGFGVGEKNGQGRWLRPSAESALADLERNINGGLSLSMKGEDVQRIFTTTFQQASMKDGTYYLYQKKMVDEGNPEYVEVASVVRKAGKYTVTMENPELEYSLGDYLFISAEKDKKDDSSLLAYIPVSYYERRVFTRGKHAIFRNGDKNMEMTLINITGEHSPFELNAEIRRRREEAERIPVHPSAEAQEPQLPKYSPIQSGVDAEAAEITRQVTARTPPALRIGLERHGLKQAILPPVGLGLSVPVMFYRETSTITERFNPDQNFVPASEISRNSLRAAALTFGVPVPTSGQTDVSAAWTQILNNNFINDPGVRGLLINSGTSNATLYAHDGTFTTDKPSHNNYAVIVVNGTSASGSVVTSTVTITDRDGAALLRGTVDMNSQMIRFNEIRAPVSMTLDNLFVMRGPLGTSISLGTVLSLNAIYNLETKLPKSLEGGFNAMPFGTVSKSFHKDGFTYTVYGGGIYSISDDITRPFGGASISRTMRGDHVRFNFNAGAGVGNARVPDPFIGVGLSVGPGVFVGAGMDVRGMRLGYLSAGYDSNRDGTLDYGVRMFNAGPIWIPDIVINGKGMMDLPAKGLKSVFKKARGIEAL